MKIYRYLLAAGFFLLTALSVLHGKDPAEGPATVAPPVSGELARLAPLADRYGPSFFAALCALPATRKACRQAVNRDWSPDAAPEEFGAKLSPGEQTAVTAAAAALLEEAGAAEGKRVRRRLAAWLRAREQLRILEELTSSEQLTAALFMVAPVRPLFTPYLAHRGLAPPDVSPQMTGETLTAAERIEITYGVLGRMADFDRNEQLAVFSALLRHLAGPQQQPPPPGRR